MAIYFSRFPTENYYFNNTYQVNITNIAARVAFEEKFKYNTSAYTTYSVKDGETPENLAYRFYNNPERHWIILLMNNIIDPLYDWPLDYSSFNRYIISKYGTLEYAASTNYAYYKVVTSTINANTARQIVNVDKVEVDANTYDDILENPGDYTYETITLQDGNSLTIQVTGETKKIYQYETEQNDLKRNIKILKQEFVPSAEDQLTRVFRE